MNLILRTALLCSALAAPPVSADIYPLPPPGVDLVGELVEVPVAASQTLADVALAEGVGFRALVQANPQVDAWLPVPGTPLLLPKRVVLPRVRREGIVINLAEMRLYYFMPATAREPARVMIVPAAVGREDWKTPLGLTKVSARVRDPVWRPTPSILAEHAADGDPLPAEVPPGPDNPLGPLALRLTLDAILIHGTNRPYGIGMPVTHGCIRLAADDMQALFEAVSVGTPVMFIDEPYKLGRDGDGQWHLEAHPVPADLAVVQERLAALAAPLDIEGLDWSAAEAVVQDARGVPVSIGPAAAQAATAAGPDEEAGERRPLF